MLKHGFCLVFCLGAATAQSVRVANHSVSPFEGWMRTTIDELPPHCAGIVDGARYVVGRQIGLSTWAVDVQLALKPNEQRVLELSKASDEPFKLGPLPSDPIAFFGGWPAVSGTALQLAAIDTDGAAAAAHFHARLDGLAHADVWLLWRPDEPWLVTGEFVWCASNPAVPDVVAPTDAVRLTWGDGLVFVAGAGWGAPVVPASSFASGQARAVPFTIVWPRHCEKRVQWLPVIAAAQRSVCGVGLRTLLPDGNPVLTPGFDGKAWTEARYAESLRRLHTFEPALIGPNPVSGDTGAQEDQVFVRGEPLGDRGVGAEQVAYLAALKIFARPCHHLNADGSIVDPPLAVPRLLYWDGMVHGNTNVSPNRLGKPRNPTLAECSGWAGPDVEHWLMNTSAAAARYTGSYALQWELRHQAMLYLGTQTSAPGLSTSSPFASRAVGWSSINAVHLWRDLEDRELAARVRQRWLDRFGLVIAPAWRDQDIVDARRDDRLGPGIWWICWQQAVGAYGLDLAGVQFEVPEARAIALRLAKTVVRESWEQRSGVWLSRAQQPVEGARPEPDGSFNYYGLSLAVAVVLRHEPNDERARAIWTQLAATPERGASWLAPGVH